MKDGLVGGRGDLSVEEAVVCEESEGCAWGEIGADVVDVDEEEERAEDCALRDAGEDWRWVGVCAVY